MKSINLLSLYQGHNSLPSSEFKYFTKHYEIEINDNELADIKVFVNEMFSSLPFIRIFNEFYVGYKIQHISKEFDLLRFGSNYIINIEIKNTSTEDKIKSN